MNLEAMPQFELALVSAIAVGIFCARVSSRNFCSGMLPSAAHDRGVVGGMWTAGGWLGGLY